MPLKKKIIFPLGFIFALPAIIYFGLLSYVFQSSAQSNITPSDAILVLGARAYINGEYNPCLLARVTHAVNLYNKKLAPKIIMSGGTDKEDNVNEAETMKKIAVEMGVNPTDILLEKSSTSTFENFKLSEELLDQNNISSIIIVTEPFHMARAKLIAANLNIKYTNSSAPNRCSNTARLTKYYLKEPIAITVYKFQNKL